MLLHSNTNNGLYTDLDFHRYKDEDDTRRGYRDDFERDYGRIIHSSAFRRLQGKTQVFGPAEGDFHRTRLTHTLEVAQIARGIVINLNNTSSILKDTNNQIDTSLVEAAALAHDLGHPPFGHQGERALHKGMLNFDSGFEGNAHTFRLLTHLEGNKVNGLNLTRTTLLSICKYPITIDKAFNPACTSLKPPKANIFIEDESVWKWLLKDFTSEETEYYTQNIIEDKEHTITINKTLECSIVELADDIAYATHDLQDVIKYNLLQLKDFKDTITAIDNPGRYEYIIEDIKELKISDNQFDSKLKSIIANLISELVQDISLITNDSFSSPRLKYKATIGYKGKEIIEKLNKDLIYNNVILSQRLQTFEWRGGHIIEKLFDTLINDPKLLPNDKQLIIKEDEELKPRIVCDYIAGMTDKYAENFYKRLFESNGGRLFDF